MQAAPKQSVPPRQRRMTIEAISRERTQIPPRVVIYGGDGIGKSTFASHSPNPVFVCAEDGLGQIQVDRFRVEDDTGFVDVLDAIESLTSDPHEFQTLVIDTLDWLEPLVWRFVCERDKKADLDAYGYGRGLVAALDQWRVLLAALERLRRGRNMGVVLIAHAWIKPFKNPSGDDFERYEMKLDKRAARLISEWADAVLFANYETLTIENDRTKRVKGISSGARLLHTTYSAAWDAKNRFSLPEVLPLSWSEFDAAIKAGIPADPKQLEAAILAEADGTEIESKAAEYVAKAKGDAVKLAQTLNWVRARREKEA